MRLTAYITIALTLSYFRFFFVLDNGRKEQTMSRKSLADESARDALIEEHKTERRVLVKELSTLGGMIRGSLLHTKRKCGQKGCRCSTAGELHEVCLLSTSVTGRRNRMTYVRPTEESRFRTAVESYLRAWEIIERLTELNIADIKEGK